MVSKNVDSITKSVRSLVHVDHFAKMERLVICQLHTYSPLTICFPFLFASIFDFFSDLLHRIFACLCIARPTQLQQTDIYISPHNILISYRRIHTVLFVFPLFRSYRVLTIKFTLPSLSSLPIVLFFSDSSVDRPEKNNKREIFHTSFIIYKY